MTAVLESPPAPVAPSHAQRTVRQEPAALPDRSWLDVAVPQEAINLEGFLDWCASDEFPAGIKASLINGVLRIEPSMDDLFPQNALKTAIIRALGNFGEQTKTGRTFSGGAMYAHMGDGRGNEPDVIFLRFDSLRAGRCSLEQRQPGANSASVIYGAADLVVECVSPSSETKDTRDLRDAYFSAGVSEYWILDGRGENLIFHLLTREQTAEDWKDAAVGEQGVPTSPVLGQQVAIERIFDPAGYPDWSVTLSTAEPTE
ncbi:MAG: Uma2 family endonuclease [Planctomycetota bacterium]